MAKFGLYEVIYITYPGATEANPDKTEYLHRYLDAGQNKREIVKRFAQRIEEGRIETDAKIRSAERIRIRGFRITLDKIV